MKIFSLLGLTKKEETAAVQPVPDKMQEHIKQMRQYAKTVGGFVMRVGAMVDSWGSRSELVRGITETSKLPPSIIVAFLLGVFFILYAVGAAPHIICNAIGLLYPCYAAYKTLCLENATRQQLAFWLKYLVIFFVITVLGEAPLSFLFPFLLGFWYYTAKVLLLMALYYPSVLNLAFDKLRMFIHPYEQVLDDNIRAIQQSAISETIQKQVGALVGSTPEEEDTTQKLRERTRRL